MKKLLIALALISAVSGALAPAVLAFPYGAKDGGSSCQGSGCQ